MKLDPNFVRDRKISGDLESGKLFARRPGTSRSHDVIVAAALLALESHGRLPVFGNRNGHRERARYEWVSPRDSQDDFNNSELYGANPPSRESDSLSDVSSSGRSFQPTASNAKTAATC